MSLVHLHLYPALLLALALAAFVWRLTRRGGGGGGGGALYPRLLRGAWLGFGLPAFVLLGLDGAWPGLWRIPPAFDGVRGWLGVAEFGPGDHRKLALACLAGVGIGAVAALAATAWQAWRGRGVGTLFGDARALIPTHPRDYGAAALVALSAGVTEEAFFRLLLPLLTAQATGSATLGFAGATLLFGGAHRYQGWRGVLATTVAGGAMALAYLATASLALVMALHATGDLIHLVARPALRRWIERRRTDNPPPR